MVNVKSRGNAIVVKRLFGLAVAMGYLISAITVGSIFYIALTNNAESVTVNLNKYGEQTAEYFISGFFLVLAIVNGIVEIKRLCRYG